LIAHDRYFNSPIAANMYRSDLSAIARRLATVGTLARTGTPENLRSQPKYEANKNRDVSSSWDAQTRGTQQPRNNGKKDNSSIGRPAKARTATKTAK